MKDMIISTLTTKSQTVIPKEIRLKMGLKPGDAIRYRLHGDAVRIEKFVDAQASVNPFAAFDEWASPEDDRAFAHLQDR